LKDIFGVLIPIFSSQKIKKKFLNRSFLNVISTKTSLIILKHFKKYGEVVKIGIMDNSNLTNLLIIEYCYHFQAVDAVKGIRYLYGVKNEIRFRVWEAERRYPIFCLLSPKE